jgi:hypothetical protein
MKGACIIVTSNEGAQSRKFAHAVEGCLDFCAVVVSARILICFIGPRKSRALTLEACEICIPSYTI